MSHPSESWSERISAAESVEAQRELLAEAARWRAQHLNDVPAIRRATYAISRLLALVGDRDRAVGEARQLASLLQTTPEASDEELESVRGHLNSLGVPMPRMPTAGPPRRGRDRERPERDPRESRDPRDPRDRMGARPERGARTQPDRPLRGRRDEPTNGARRVEAPGQVLQDARRAAANEDYEGALHALDGLSGSGAGLIRLYAKLSQALIGPEPAAAVGAVRLELARLAGISVRGAASDPDDPLAQLLGESVPQKRVARIRAIEDFAEAHPNQIDELAAASLRHHLTHQGPTAPAPWLVGVVGRALTTGDAPSTNAAIAELRAARSVAVAAYDEWPFERLIRLRKRADALGFDVGGMRRGVLARGEPDDRKLWTLRVAKDGIERMVAVAPHAAAPYPPGNAEELAPRLRELCPRTLLVATGSGNAQLRAAAEAEGLVVREHDADDDALLTLISSMEGPATTGTEPSTSTSSPPDQLASLLAEESPSIEALAEVVRTFRRPDRALRVVHRLGLDDARTAAILRAVDAATEPGRVLPEGTTLAVLAAARGPQTRALLASDPSVSARFAGPAVEVVADVVKALLDGGWEVHRVLRGPTRRETQAHPALETFAPAMGGLWRLLVRQAVEAVQSSPSGPVSDGFRKGEVWYLAELPPEGRAGVPLLLLEDWQRVIVAPVDPELLAWWRTLGAANPLGWTGSEGADLLAAVGAFTARSGDHDRSSSVDAAVDGAAGADDEAPAGS